MEKIKDYFYYTKSERNGTLVLAIVCFLLFLSSHLLPFMHTQEPIALEQFVVDTLLPGHLAEADTTSSVALLPFDPNLATRQELLAYDIPEKTVRTILNFREKVGRFEKPEDLKKVYNLSKEDYDQLLPHIRIATPGKKYQDRKTTQPIHSEVKKRSFNPNTITKAELLNYGVPDRIANTILNYRNKGGIFRQKGDLKKIYGLSPDLYDQLAPYIVIDNAATDGPPANVGKVTRQSVAVVRIDINQATAQEWRQLKGIGPFYSKRITNFRQKLGGFYSIDQVAETYGLPDSTFQKIKPFLHLTPLTQKISINQITVDSLARHPYITYRQARAIVNYRINHGPFESWEDFKNILVLTPEEQQKLAHYLQFR